MPPNVTSGIRKTAGKKKGEKASLVLLELDTKLAGVSPWVVFICLFICTERKRVCFILASRLWECEVPGPAGTTAGERDLQLSFFAVLTWQGKNTERSIPLSGVLVGYMQLKMKAGCVVNVVRSLCALLRFPQQKSIHSQVTGRILLPDPAQ